MEKTLLTQDTEVKVITLISILEKATSFTQHIDHQINILIGVNSAIFVVSISQVQNGRITTIPFLVLAFFSALATLVSLLAVHPPQFMRKRGQEESMMYNKRITQLPSAYEYNQEIDKAMSSPEAIIKQYSLEIYNLYSYYYRPKRKLFQIARNILMIGVAISLLSFSINVFL